MSLSTGNGDAFSGPPGHTYAALVVAGAERDDVTATLRGLRFSGWVAPPEENGLIVVVPAHGGGSVAAGRRGVAGVGEALAVRFRGAVFAVRVVDDRQMLLMAWDGGEELGRYLSDPSYGLDREDDTLPFPYGEKHAHAFAAAWHHPENGDELAGLLGEELDDDHMIESERLKQVLRLLGLPTWLVAVASLPKDVPTGPRARDLIRLGAGSPGVGGRLLGALSGIGRRRLRPPPPVTDAPRGVGPGADPWLM